MFKAVLDTSIIVSAFLKHEGVNAKVLLGGKDQYELFLSEDILAETRLVLLTYERIRKKYHYTDDEVWEYLETLSVVAKQVLGKLPKIRVIERDPKDDPVLACALKVKADYIVSKDDHLKDLKEYRGVRIVSSQEFLELLK